MRPIKKFNRSAAAAVEHVLIIHDFSKGKKTDVREVLIPYAEIYAWAGPKQDGKDTSSYMRSKQTDWISVRLPLLELQRRLREPDELGTVDLCDVTGPEGFVLQPVPLNLKNWAVARK